MQDRRSTHQEKIAFVHIPSEHFETDIKTWPVAVAAKKMEEFGRNRVEQASKPYAENETFVRELGPSLQRGFRGLPWCPASAMLFSPLLQPGQTARCWTLHWRSD